MFIEEATRVNCKWIYWSNMDRWYDQHEKAQRCVYLAGSALMIYDHNDLFGNWIIYDFVTFLKSTFKIGWVPKPNMLFYETLRIICRYLFHKINPPVLTTVCNCCVIAKQSNIIWFSWPTDICRWSFYIRITGCTAHNPIICVFCPGATTVAKVKSAHVNSWYMRTSENRFVLFCGIAHKNI